MQLEGKEKKKRKRKNRGHARTRPRWPPTTVSTRGAIFRNFARSEDSPGPFWRSHWRRCRTWLSCKDWSSISARLSSWLLPNSLRRDKPSSFIWSTSYGIYLHTLTHSLARSLSRSGVWCVFVQQVDNIILNRSSSGVVDPTHHGGEALFDAEPDGFLSSVEIVEREIRRLFRRQRLSFVASTASRQTPSAMTITADSRQTRSVRRRRSTPGISMEALWRTRDRLGACTRTCNRQVQCREGWAKSLRNSDEPSTREFSRVGRISLTNAFRFFRNRPRFINEPSASTQSGIYRNQVTPEQSTGLLSSSRLTSAVKLKSHHCHTVVFWQRTTDESATLNSLRWARSRSDTLLLPRGTAKRCFRVRPRYVGRRLRWRPGKHRLTY